MKPFNILILPFLYIALTAQINVLTQEEAEQRALELYEKDNPPRDTVPMPAPAEYEEYFGSRLTRSVSLLSTSNKERRLPVKILIYGQSIVGSRNFSECMSAYLTEHFPYADITIENRAIGGFSGDRLLRTAVHDVYPFYPDLLIFHVYGGEDHGELEQLFTNVRQYTTADILLFNHHLNANQKTYIEKSYQFLRYIANKYNCELVDVSKEWMQYLADNDLQPSDLLRDNVHPNRHGHVVLSNLIGRHLRYNFLYPGFWQDRVRTVYLKSAYDVNAEKQIFFKGKKWEIIDNVPVGKSKDAPIKFTFEGNRVDIIAGKLKNPETLGSAKIILDGKLISKNKDIPYSITRPSPGPNTWIPLVRRISYIKALVPEDWTLMVDEINQDSTIWFFSVRGTVTGFDGSGRSDEAFTSKSGRVVIDPSDYMFAEIVKTFKTVTPVGFESKWKVEPMFIETYQSPAMDDKSKVYKTTIVKGLKNGLHTLELIPNEDGILPIEAFEVHRPDM